MAFVFVKVDIYKSAWSEFHGRALTSADSPIDIPIHEAEPLIKGGAALEHDGAVRVELDADGQAELNKLIAAVTAEFLEGYVKDESRESEAPSAPTGLVSAEQPGECNTGVGDGGRHLGGG